MTRFTNAEVEMIKMCVRYVLEAPCLEVIEGFTPAEERTGERLLKKLEGWK